MSNDYVLGLSPTDFEKYCYDFLKGYAEEEKLKNFSITHNVKIETYDGTYQIDVYAEFTALNSKFKVLCECKQYTSSVSREKVAVLHDKLESIGAHKGILLATSDFQSGAIKYAKAHGITLITVEDHTFKNHSFSNESGILDENDPCTYGIRHMPPVIASIVSTETGTPQRIYPTKTMLKNLLIEQTKRVNEVYGLNIQIDDIIKEKEE